MSSLHDGGNYKKNCSVKCGPNPWKCKASSFPQKNFLACPLWGQHTELQCGLPCKDEIPSTQLRLPRRRISLVTRSRKTRCSACHNLYKIVYSDYHHYVSFWFSDMLIIYVVTHHACWLLRCLMCVLKETVLLSFTFCFQVLEMCIWTHFQEQNNKTSTHSSVSVEIMQRLIAPIFNYTWKISICHVMFCFQFDTHIMLRNLPQELNFVLKSFNAAIWKMPTEFCKWQNGHCLTLAAQRNPNPQTKLTPSLFSSSAPTPSTCKTLHFHRDHFRNRKTEVFVAFNL